MENRPDHDPKLDLLVVSRLLESARHREGAGLPMFCQMNRLTDSGTEIIWMEIARWIRYEEALDEDANRWSKPHVPSLSLKALTSLRKELRHAPLLLDPEIVDYTALVDKLVSTWIQEGYLDRQLEDGIKMALLKPHRHVHERKLPRPASVGSNLLAVKERGLGGSSVSLQSLESFASGKDNSAYDSNEDVSDAASMKGTPKQPRKNVKFQRKIPKNAVATNILVAELTCLRRPLMALVRLTPSRHLGWLCEVRLPTEFIFICLVPEASDDNDVTEIGRCMGALMTDPIFREVAENSTNRFEVLAGLTEFAEHLTALPASVWDSSTRLEPPAKVPSQDFRRNTKKILEEKRQHVEEQIIHHEDEDEEGLTMTGRLFGGVVDDVKRKLPWYISDFKDCLSVQCIASTIFLFLATLTPNVTFGGLLGQETEQYMGTMECILAAAITGVLFALFAGQPLNILGSTGPMLVLEVIIFDFCKDQGWDFLSFRVWIGFWTTAILLVIVAFDLSALVKFITRFTEECFASLIAIIFIYEAFAKVIKISSKYPAKLGLGDHPPACVANDSEYEKNNSILQELIAVTTASSAALDSNLTDTNNCKDYVPDVFFLSILEFLFTFGIAYSLVQFRNSIFFPNIVRRMMSDFGVLIAIVIVVGVDALLNVDTPKLTVPQEFRPTRPDRPWFISPVSDRNPIWLAVAAALPAILAVILIFMDQQITAVIVNRKEHKLKKGSGYHLDILVLAILITVLSLLGLPWYVAATVSALAHVMSLKVESDCAAPGEKPEFLGVREQRVTALLVGILSGLSVLLTGVLKHIPLPVLYGVFLFMGVRALNGMQLVDRFMLYLISPKYQPDYAYLRHVPLLRVHIFTLIQILCLAGLWIIKSFKETSILFPIMVLAICFIRKLLDFVFTQYELSWLDHLLPAMSLGRKKQKVILQQVITMETKRKAKDYDEPTREMVDIPQININDPVDLDTQRNGNDVTSFDSPITPTSPNSSASPTTPEVKIVFS